MANYSSAAEGLDDLVRRRTLKTAGVPDQQETDPFATTGADAGLPGVPDLLPGAPDKGTPEGLPYSPEQAGQPSVPSAPSQPAGYQPSTVNTSVQAGSGGDLAEAFTRTLMGKLNRPISASLSDPNLAAQSDAYAVGQTRARDNARAAMAERMAQEGTGGTGGFDQNLAGLFQQQGENQGTFNANLVGNELQAQRDELMRYAAMAGSRLSDMEARALQARISEIDAELRKQGINNQAAQYDSSMGWNQAIWNYLQNQAPWGAAGVPGQ